MSRRRWFLLLPALLLAVLLLPLPPAAADSAPLMPLAPGLQPTESTTVRMESEHIDIHVARQPGGHFNEELVEDVAVQFHFVPAGDETMTAGFPLGSSIPQGFSGVPVEEFTVTAGGKALPFTQQAVTWNGQRADWAVWQLTFTKGQPLDLTVRYRLRFGSLGKGPASDLLIYYLLRTGSYWAGTIGRAEAVVTLDTPIRAEDIQTGPATTPGYTLQDGKLVWVWQNIKPDFDLNLRMSNPFWLDGMAEFDRFLQQPHLSRADTLTAIRTAAVLFQGDKMGNWAPFRDGRPSGEVAGAELPKVVAAAEAAIAAAPQDLDLQQAYVGMLNASLWHYTDKGRQFLGADRLERFYAAAARLQQAGGEYPYVGIDSRDRAWIRTFWAELASAAYNNSTDVALRKAALASLTRLLPEHFTSGDDARSWVSMLLINPPPALVDDMTAVALQQVEPPSASPTPAAPAQPAQVQPASAPGPSLSSDMRDAWHKSTWPLWLYGGAGVLVLVAGVWISRRRWKR